jgi:glutaredoxin
MKVVIFVLENCPFTKSAERLIRKMDARLETISPLTCSLNINGKKVSVEWVILPHNKTRAMEIQRKFKLAPIMSYPTIVKVDGKRSTVFEGTRSVGSFMKFLV